MNLKKIFNKKTRAQATSEWVIMFWLVLGGFFLMFAIAVGYHGVELNAALAPEGAFAEMTGQSGAAAVQRVSGMLAPTMNITGSPDYLWWEGDTRNGGYWWSYITTGNVDIKWAPWIALNWPLEAAVIMPDWTHRDY